MPISPPPVPTTSIYTSCWCEENIYLLTEAFTGTPEVVEQWEVCAVFISNPNKTVALWEQKLARDHLYPVVWDYHVIMILRPRKRSLSADGDTVLRVKDEQDDDTRAISWVYDFDTHLPLPCPFAKYMTQTFRKVDAQYKSMFRVVPAKVLLDNFACDRSHMLVKRDSGEDQQGDQQYHSIPPAYPPIVGAKAKELGVSNNLMASFVSMVLTGDGGGFGEIMELDAMLIWDEAVVSDE
ncbi:hypothetical protein HGRIS_013208 [Hohenbuehelia grisea]|uniref:Protein N-terminal glutamine amidohydrolase n=1 Tax=Hohenbuehelia grisea TaxID=104357 RepID=A0ABR3IUV3_9AGAR